MTTPSATLAPATVCPRCGATLRPEQATWIEGAPGYLPQLKWTHRRPDDGRPCHLGTGPPVGYRPPTPAEGAGTVEC
jgi:hypothetical protein